MKREEVRNRIQDVGIFPAVRVSSAELALFGAETVYEAGIPIIEITMTVPGALDVIAQLVRKLPGLTVGAGTVLDADTAQRCLDAGASFLTSPGLVTEVVEVALARNIVIIPGALTPSEVIAAWKAKVDFVKIFPCSLMGGERYIRALKVPLPQVPMIASGGVNQMTAADFILAGASAIGIRSELMPKEALLTRNREWIHELARRFVTIVREARAMVNDN